MINPTYKKAFFTSAPSAEAYLGDLKSDGTIPLTANWDVGAYAITALRFVSDQATGTAPFTVASTTAVTNLNADLLDGVHAASFVKADGTVPLTADWNVGAFSLTADNLTAEEVLGDELVTDPSTWTHDGNFTYAGGAWTHGGVAGNSLGSGITLTAGKWYKVTFTTSDASGNWSLSGGGSAFRYVTSAGAQVFYVYASTTAAISWYAYTAYTGSFSNFSIKEVVNTAAVISGHNYRATGQYLVESGSSKMPGFSFIDNPDTGLFNYGAYLEVTVDGVNSVTIAGSGIVVSGNGSDAGTNISIGGASDVLLYRSGAYNLQLGADAAAPIDYRMKAGDGSGTDKPGAMLSLAGGQSTGTGVGGSLKLQTSYTSTTGTTANTYYTRYIADGKVHTVDNNTATAMFSIALADGNAVGGYINYTVEVTDGTDFQIESGTFTFAAVNKATETWTTDADKGTASAVVSGGTLAVTWAVDTATADTVKVTVNSNSSLTPTSSKIQFQIFLNSPKVITIL